MDLSVEINVLTFNVFVSSFNYYFKKKMNKEVANALKKVINSWLTGERSYTFETRGIRCCKQLPGNGEYLFVFYLRIDGFYVDSKLSQPINLDFTSQEFITNNLNVTNHENINGDAIHLKNILDSFTEDCYNKTKTEVGKHPDSYTSDFLYWK